MFYDMARQSTVKENSKTIGARLARFRKEKGYTQAELAEKVGTIQALVSDYELDKLRLHAEMVLKFAKALGVSSDELLGLKKEKKNGKDDNPKKSRIWNQFQKILKLPERDQRAIMRMVNSLTK